MACRVVESADVPGWNPGGRAGSQQESAEIAMDARIAIAVALLIGATAQAAEPPAAAAADQSRKPAAATQSTARAPLKLGIGDVRKYMMPNDYRSAMNMPDADKTTVIVQGERHVAPLQSELPQPVALGAVYSLFRHPTTAWRLFVPDTSAYAPKPGPPDVVPPREFRWGP
jgi:hypothetical protein